MMCLAFWGGLHPPSQVINPIALKKQVHPGTLPCLVSLAFHGSQQAFPHGWAARQIVCTIAARSMARTLSFF